MSKYFKSSTLATVSISSEFHVKQRIALTTVFVQNIGGELGHSTPVQPVAKFELTLSDAEADAACVSVNSASESLCPHQDKEVETKKSSDLTDGFKDSNADRTLPFPISNSEGDPKYAGNLITAEEACCLIEAPNVLSVPRNQIREPNYRAVHPKHSYGSHVHSLRSAASFVSSVTSSIFPSPKLEPLSGVTTPQRIEPTPRTTKVKIGIMWRWGGVPKEVSQP
ncbi:hypothetical protein DFH07DRAFT_778729 [Mycena maculata]|uniref:Uncharacterized protein n=1 Tax=Mycena maculata TaxID=230809 RepID=A0AAD7IDA3_9AGAR|nr:hypothetical protein DFH07DRAFT_778729 [Mycena maculata]